MIYFIESETSKAIKIGYSEDPSKRLAGLQTATSEPLRLLATMPGGFREEKILHQVFNEFRLQGEWFSPDEPNDSIPEFVAGITSAQRALKPFANLAYPELSYLTSNAVGHYCSIYWVGGGPTKPGTLYQVMHGDSESGREFWSWHSVHQPPYFWTPEEACIAYVASHRDWISRNSVTPNPHS